MASFSDFINLQKKDYHSNLDLGMRYPSYVAWAGFFIPGFPEDGSAAEKNLWNDIRTYTETRVGSEKDIQNLLTLSLTESQADNIVEVNGSIGTNLLNISKSREKFLHIIEKSAKKNSRIKLNPVLRIDTDSTNSTELDSLLELFDTGIFKGVYLYGSNLESSPQKYSLFLSTAKKKNIFTEINASSVKSTSCYKNLIRTLEPAIVLQGEAAAKDREISALLKAAASTVIFTPNPFSPTDRVSVEAKAQFMRTLLEAGVNVRLGTEALLLLNKSISQFAADLCNTAVFTKEELEKLL